MASDDDEFRNVNLSSRCEWHPETVSRLLNSYGEKCSHGKGYLKTKDWEDIVNYVNIQCEGSKTLKTMKQCREKVDSLKRRYKLEKRKAELRGSSHVDWSFYEKLDEIMCCMKKNGGGTSTALSSEGHSFELVEPLDFDEGFENDNIHHQNFLSYAHHNRLDLIVPDNPVADKGKSLLENTDGLCDVVLNAVDLPSNNKRRKPSKDFQRMSGKKQKRPVNSEKNPVQALADALVGFSEVYSRMEVAKIELFTKMNLELAKLRKRRRKDKNSGESSGFSSCSAYSSSAPSSSDSDGE
ncbi:trihelix transcription factor ENAP2 [Cryptomeria japonica]|uniref:trihelix transcription factor ENAP2 n=1 Tax=Cryptomeria japonica TaxID=3369 RepID=UPI0025AC01C3|nr:trihelix transcription factor ENAP2 [Cryptomeria japonica]